MEDQSHLPPLAGLSTLVSSMVCTMIFCSCAEVWQLLHSREAEMAAHNAGEAASPCNTGARGPVAEGQGLRARYMVNQHGSAMFSVQLWVRPPPSWSVALVRHGASVGGETQRVDGVLREGAAARPGR